MTLWLLALLIVCAIFWGMVSGILLRHQHEARDVIAVGWRDQLVAVFWPLYLLVTLVLALAEWGWLAVVGRRG